MAQDPDVGRRALGLIIDLTLVIPGAVVMAASILAQPHETRIGPGSIQASSSGAPTGLFWIGWLLALVLYVGNRVVLQGLTGRSLGKRAVGTRLVRIDNRAEVPGIGRTTVRFLFEMVGWIDLLVALVTERHQRIGDVTMKTIVTRETDRNVAASHSSGT
jgi:uncharacterized RDD family membrane protein YckC